MADYSFGYGGVGSSLDISGIVSQLVAADRAPMDARLTKLESATKFKISGLGTVTSAFSTLKTALEALKKVDSLAARAVKSASADGGNVDNVLSASGSRNIPVGSYQVEVLSLASAHKLVGAGVAEDATFGAGRLSLSLGAETVEIEIGEGNTLADVRSAINKAAQNLGVQASLLRSDDGLHLSVASDKTGAGNVVSLQVLEGGSDLAGLVAGLEERSPASDAQVSIDGLVTTSASNKISDAVPGLTLELKKTGTSKVTVDSDPAASRTAVQGFVNAYNGAIKALASVTSFNAGSNTPSSLTGDAQIRGAASQLRSVLGNLLGELAVGGLDARTLGLQTQGYPNPDGSLVLDAAKFDAALAAEPGKVAAAFTGDQGLAARLAAVVDNYVGSEGAFTLRSKTLNDQLKDVAKQRETLELRMESVAARYKAQFVALDGLMGQMTTTSNYLAQQLTAIAAQTSR